MCAQGARSWPESCGFYAGFGGSVFLGQITPHLGEEARYVQGSFRLCGPCSSARKGGQAPEFCFQSVHSTS